MALKIITADERLNTMTVKGQIWGPAGVGKTTLLKTLDPATTLAIVPEDGMLSVQRDDQFGPRYMGDSIIPESWLEEKSILNGFKGLNPDGSKGERPAFLRKFRTVFLDSTSVISKQCFAWCQTQPDAFSEKTGKPDVRGAYGLLAREMSDWAWGWKNIPDLNVWMIGGLEQKEVAGIKEWMPLVMGAKLATELPYIMDFSLVMGRLPAADGKVYTGFFTDPLTNPEYASVPLKTRGGGLLPFEQPHLGKLMAKATGLSMTAPPPSSVPTALGDGTLTPPNQSEAA